MCIAPSEYIFRPGEGGVQPPQLKEDKNLQKPKIKGPFTFELLVSAEGRICSVKILSARDRWEASKAADYIAQNWSFAPATTRGQPVAAMFTVNFGPS